LSRGTLGHFRGAESLYDHRGYGLEREVEIRRQKGYLTDGEAVRSTVGRVKGYRNAKSGAYPQNLRCHLSGPFPVGRVQAVAFLSGHTVHSWMG